MQSHKSSPSLYQAGIHLPGMYLPGTWCISLYPLSLPPAPTHNPRLPIPHPLEQVGPENGHEYEDAEQAQAADEKQDLRAVRAHPVPLEGILR